MPYALISTSRWSRLLAAALIATLVLSPQSAFALHTLEPTESTTRVDLTRAVGLEEPRRPQAGAIPRRTLLTWAIGTVGGTVGGGTLGALAWHERYGLFLEEAVTPKPVAPERRLRTEHPSVTDSRELLPPGYGVPAQLVHQRIEQPVGTPDHPEASARAQIQATLPRAEVYDLLVASVETANLQSLTLTMTSGGRRLRPWVIDDEEWLNRGVPGVARPLFLRVSELPSDSLAPYDQFTLTIEPIARIPTADARCAIHEITACVTDEYAVYAWREGAWRRGGAWGALVGLGIGGVAAAIDWRARRMAQKEAGDMAGMKTAAERLGEQVVLERMEGVFRRARQFLNDGRLARLRQDPRMPDENRRRACTERVAALLRAFDEQTLDVVQLVRGVQEIVEATAKDSVLEDSALFQALWGGLGQLRSTNSHFGVVEPARYAALLDESQLDALIQITSEALAVVQKPGPHAGLEEPGPRDPQRREFLRSAGLGAIGLWAGAMTGQVGGRALAWQTADPTTTTFLTQTRVLIPDQEVPAGMQLLRNPDTGPGITTLHWPAPRSTEQITLRAELEPPAVGRPVPVGYDTLYMEFSTVNLGTLRIAVSNGVDPWTEIVVGSARLNTERRESLELPVQTSLTNLPGQPSMIRLRFRATLQDPRYPIELSFGALAEATRWPSPFEQKATRWGRWGGGALGALGLALGAAFGLYGPQLARRRTQLLAPDELARLERVCAVVKMAQATFLLPERRVTDPPPETDAIRWKIRQALGYASDIRKLLLALEQATGGYGDPRLKVQRLVALFDGGNEWVLQRAVERLSQALPSEPASTDRGGLEESAIVNSLVPPLAEALAANGQARVAFGCAMNLRRSAAAYLEMAQWLRRAEIPWMTADSTGLALTDEGGAPEPRSALPAMSSAAKAAGVDPDLVDQFHPKGGWPAVVEAADLILVAEPDQRDQVVQHLKLPEPQHRVRLFADLVPPDEDHPLRQAMPIPDDFTTLVGVSFDALSPIVRGGELLDVTPERLIQAMPDILRPLQEAILHVHQDAVKDAQQFLGEWGKNAILPGPGTSWAITDMETAFEMPQTLHEAIPAFIQHAHYAIIAHPQGGIAMIRLYVPAELLEEARQRFSQSPPLSHIQFEVHDASELVEQPQPPPGTPWLLLWPGTADLPTNLPSERLLWLEKPLAAYTRAAIAAIAFDPAIAQRFPLVVAVPFTVDGHDYLTFFL